MEARLCDFFTTTNAMMLTETILESTYKVLQSSWKRMTLKQPAQFWKAVQL